MTLDDQSLGEMSEFLVMAHIRGLQKEHRWILDARRANRLEDASGIDVVVTTDVGDVPVQVKSSRGGAAKWRQHNRKTGHEWKNDIPTVIAAAGITPAELRQRVHAAVARRRAWILEGIRPASRTA